MKNRFNAVLATVLVMMLCFALPMEAAVGPATASTTINVTVSESVSVSATPSSVSGTYSSGSLVLAPITVNSSWFTNGSEHEFIVYATFSGGANALANGGSSIPSSAIIANVTGSAPINGLYSSGFAPTIGGNMSNTLQDQITVPNAVFIFSASVDGKVAPGFQQWTPTPSGSATNQVTLTITPTGSLNPGTYTGVLNFIALAQ
jgi:hypothetical protein